jgi:hypothetical protein
MFPKEKVVNSSDWLEMTEGNVLQEPSFQQDFNAFYGFSYGSFIFFSI